MSRRRAALERAACDRARWRCGACGGDDSGSDGSTGASSPDNPQTTVASRRAPTPSIRRRSTSRPPRAWSRFARSSQAAAPACSTAADRRRRDRASSSRTPARSPPTPTSSPTGRPAAARSARRRRSTSSFPTATRSGRHRRLRPPRRRGAPQGRPGRPRPAPPRARDREEVKVGQPVAAIGSPFGEDRSLSIGVVSATDRSIQSLTQFQIDGRSRRTPRSTPATRAARCSMPTAT